MKAYVFKNKRVLTRIPHKCTICNKTFAAKTRMQCVTVKVNKIENVYFCKSCMQIYFEGGRK